MEIWTWKRALQGSMLTRFTQNGKQQEMQNVGPVSAEASQ